VKRREFITLIGGAAAAWPLAARAQQPKRIPRLCFLTFDPGTLRSTRFEAFFQGLHDLGYVDGQTAMASGSRLWLPNASDSRRTSSQQVPLRLLRPQRE
jgi:hypothetical protein